MGPGRVRQTARNRGPAGTPARPEPSPPAPHPGRSYRRGPPGPPPRAGQPQGSRQERRRGRGRGAGELVSADASRRPGVSPRAARRFPPRADGATSRRAPPAPPLRSGVVREGSAGPSFSSRRPTWPPRPCRCSGTSERSGSESLSPPPQPPRHSNPRRLT